jgi:hypothetical protein
MALKVLRTVLCLTPAPGSPDSMGLRPPPHSRARRLTPISLPAEVQSIFEQAWHGPSPDGAFPSGRLSQAVGPSEITHGRPPPDGNVTLYVTRSLKYRRF